MGIKKLILPLFLLVGVGIVVLLNQADIFSRPYNLGIQDSIQTIQGEVGGRITALRDTAAEKIQLLAPPPLRTAFEEIRSSLTRNGVITETNRARAANGIGYLTENIVLNAVAEAKANDLFEKQYFEHISPSGIDAADLADAGQYEYIAIGENLALGNYKDDAALVTAWMESPGHRENILNQRFQEIGVAVKKGTFEGRNTWVGVQIFAKPRASCPAVSGELLASIQSREAQIDADEAEAARRRQELEAWEPKTREEYEHYKDGVKAYNDFVAVLNDKIRELKELVARYNSQVENYNACINT